MRETFKSTSVLGKSWLYNIVVALYIFECMNWYHMLGLLMQRCLNKKLVLVNRTSNYKKLFTDPCSILSNMWVFCILYDLLLCVHLKKTNREIIEPCSCVL